jgi:asparagine synthase (glutamine-hydrolysing)
LERKKKGFGIPLAAWLRRLPPGPVTPIDGLDDRFMAQRWDAHRLGREDQRLLLWCWLSLQQTLRQDER